MIPTVLEAFNNHAAERELVGKLVLGYSDIELDLAHLASQVIGDEDTAFKVLYRTRGESQRVEVADALIRAHLAPGKFRTCYEETICHVRHCLKIRNQYAHATWIGTPAGMRFADLEEIAREHAIIDLAALTRREIDLSLLKEQEAFFRDVDASLYYLNLEQQRQAGEIANHACPAPRKLTRPNLYN